jgi:uncharacterized MAPEG superfamily protein
MGQKSLAGPCAVNILESLLDMLAKVLSPILTGQQSSNQTGMSLKISWYMLYISEINFLRGLGLWCLTCYIILVLLVEETGVPEENQRPAASHWQTLSHNVVSSTPNFLRG